MNKVLGRRQFVHSSLKVFHGKSASKYRANSKKHFHSPVIYFKSFSHKRIRKDDTIKLFQLQPPKSSTFSSHFFSPHFKFSQIFIAYEMEKKNYFQMIKSAKSSLEISSEIELRSDDEKFSSENIT